MTQPIHCEIKTLPDSLRSALSAVGYGKRDIAVRPVETLSMHAEASDGSRGFVLLVDLATGRREEHWGSWGGANMFNPRNAVDLDTTPRPVPPGMAIVKGSKGGHVFATVYISPANTAALLPAKSELTDRQRSILAQYKSLTSAGRANEWSRYPESKPTDAELGELVALGLLSRNRAGAVSITTAGKNSAGRIY